MITEWDLHDGSALTLNESLRSRGQMARHVVFADSVPDTAIDRLLALNVSGLFLKTSPLEEVLEGLRGVLDGQRRFCSRLRQRFLREGRSPSAPAAVLEGLTPRQMEVLVQLAHGATVKEVATRLHLTAKAVDSMKYRLMKAFQFHDRVELTRFAIREGLIQA
jgi:DNA-binding NarL/FixJ family response regulator